MEKVVNIWKKKNTEQISNLRMFNDLFTNHRNVAFIVNASGEFIEVSGDTEKLFGYSKNALLYSSFTNYIYFVDQIKVIKYFNEALDGTLEEKEFRVVHKNGDIKYISVTAVPSTINGEILGIYGIAKDITIIKENFVNESERRFEALIQHSTDVIGILDCNGYIKYQSSSVKKVLGYKPKELIGTNGFDIIFKEDLNIARDLFFSVTNTPNLTKSAEFRIKRSDGDWLYCEVTVTNLLDDDNVNGMVVNYRDITDRKKHECYDYLTGLPNLEMYEKQLSEKIKRAFINNQKLAILCIGLDRFRRINESVGRKVGDLLLQRVSERLKLCIGEEALLFRQGADEFFVILTDVDREGVAKVSDKILQTLTNVFTINGLEIYTTASIGISMFPEGGTSSEHLTRDADMAMYKAKQSGKNTYRFFSESKNEFRNSLKVEMELHRALERDELTLYYQPKIDLKTGKIVGIEALLRWIHPMWGVIAPNEFIPIAEETGLIIPIGEWALYTACKQNKLWQANGFTNVVSVNLSVRQFTQLDLVHSITKILEETGLEPQLLELEITESMTANIEHTITTLNALKKIGVKISVDDFGTGYSSLNYLKQFPIDTIKIDQSFVRELINNASDEMIVKMIISMAHNLNLKVIAEGIETKEQLDFLQQHLCNEGQGYFFSKPKPANELEVLLISHVAKDFGITQLEQEGLRSEKTSFWDKEKKDSYLKSEKFKVISEVAACFAHEIRNPITSIKGFIQLFEQGSIKGDYFNHIYSSLNSIEKYIQEILAISNPGPLQQKRVNIKCLIDNVKEQIDVKDLKRNNIDIHQVIEPDLPLISCDSAQLKKVILHLVTNSIEAIAGRGLVCIHVKIEHSNLLIKVTDNGIGMSKERLTHLGTPFFCTKEKGTGLGLMLCQQIIWQHKGLLHIKSKENKGTIVEVRLPLS
ncbi:EAL domain-containing protein [Bacillus solitudinis]|uniref:EAL domain-containing protein n=1 Tax=Bacillus solitudinis TaxID=2014074 RepID=UPI000C2343E0|nr:EAL domain-containing protein [Bacillus solitudinis]